MTVPRLFAYVAAALVGALIVVGVVLAVLAADGGASATFAVAAALGLPSVVLGVVVAARRPDNVVGLLLVLIGAVAAWAEVGDLYPLAVQRHPGLPVWQFYVSLTPGNWMLLYVPSALLMLVFPDGRLPGRRWRWVAGGLLTVPALFLLLAAFDPTPYPPPFQDLPHVVTAPEPYRSGLLLAGATLLPVFLGLLLAAAASVMIRFRRATADVPRAQLKWFALAAGFLPGTLLLCWASYLLLDGPDLVLVGLAATYLAIPTATAIAVLRHDLYDIDRAISTAVTYALVTTMLLGFYTVALFIIGLGLGAGGASPVAAAAATAACATALAPLRIRLQRRVDRRLYPTRQAALAAIEELRSGTHAGRAQPEQLEATLRRTLRDPALRVGYRLPGESGLVDAAGATLEPGGSLLTPVRLGGHEIGALIRGAVGSRELLRELASASALFVEVVRLRIESNRALQEAETSRARLLHAGYEERRRLERDLHDGAQQRLVSLGMALRVAQRHLGDGTVDVDGLLDSSVAELATAVAELRQIAHGLRPSSLDDGLAKALATLASKVPVPVTLDVCADPLPDDVATTAYYVASEAMANAVKHASPATIGVRVNRVDDQVTVRVDDDGLGGARMRPGAGLAGLADRVAAAGGALRLSSPMGGGTYVEAVLPCGS